MARLGLGAVDRGAEFKKLHRGDGAGAFSGQEGPRRVAGQARKRRFYARSGSNGPGACSRSQASRPHPSERAEGAASPETTMIEKDLPAVGARRAHLRRLGGRPGVPRRPGRPGQGGTVLHRDPAAQRHHAHCIWATPSAIPCRTCSAASSTCAAATCCGSPAWTMPASPTQMVVERQLMERQEPGRRDMGREKFLERVWAWKAGRAAPSSASSSGSEPPATGRASGSPWTRGCRAPFCASSSSFIATASSTRTSV